MPAFLKMPRCFGLFIPLPFTCASASAVDYKAMNEPTEKIVRAAGFTVGRGTVSYMLATLNLNK